MFALGTPIPPTKAKIPGARIQELFCPDPALHILVHTPIQVVTDTSVFHMKHFMLLNTLKMHSKLK